MAHGHEKQPITKLDSGEHEDVGLSTGRDTAEFWEDQRTLSRAHPGPTVGWTLKASPTCPPLTATFSPPNPSHLHLSLRGQDT